MPYAYEQLTVADLPRFKRLLGVFGEAFEDIETYQGAVPSDEYLRRLLARPHFLALAAMDGNEVVGGIAAYELEKFERDRREIYIYDLAVAQTHRRRGIATGLINELRRVGKKRDAYVIFVQADRGDEAAIRLYESLGTREDVYHFDILPLVDDTSRVRTCPS
jgi:aminoglycoside 3-N-acetyltransferase I